MPSVVQDCGNESQKHKIIGNSNPANTTIKKILNNNKENFELRLVGSSGTCGTRVKDEFDLPLEYVSLS